MMLGMTLALIVGGWHAPEGTSRDYAVVPRGDGAVVRRVSATTTYVGPYGDRGIAAAVLDAAPFRGKRIVVTTWSGKADGSGESGTFADVWGREGLLTGDSSNVHRQRFVAQPTKSTFVLDVPSQASDIRVSIQLSGGGEAFVERAEVEVADAAALPTGRQLVTPIDTQTRVRIASTLRDVAIPFRSPADDALAAVARAVAGVRIIGLAESAHGSAAEDARAAEIFKYLAAHDEVRVLAIEAMFGTVHHLEDYIGGAPEDADARLRETNFYAFQTLEFRHLLDWMRAENARRPAARRLHIVGVDMYYVGAQRDLVLQRLGAVDRTAGDQAKRDYACLMEGAVGESDAACLRKVRAVIPLIRNAFGSRDSVEEIHAARTVEQYLEQYTGAATRDQAIAENIAWSADTRFPGARVAVWALFFHLAGACCVGHPTAGNELAKHYGDRYYALGLIFGKGAVRAIPAGATTPREVDMPPPSPNTIEAVLDDVGADYFVDLRSPRIDEPARAWLAQPHRLRRIDLWTEALRPETTWTDERFSDALDGFFYLRSTGAPAPIEGMRTIVGSAR
jgi:erythromycin esterase